MTTVDTFDQFDQFDPPVAVPRDRWDRPLVVPPDGGKPVAYTRCTTFIDALDDKYNLGRWQQRMVAVGLADRPDLLLSVAAHREDKAELNRITKKALEAARAGAAATVGTALHALAERVDRDQPLGVLPPSALADLQAYRAALSGYTVVEIERFGVLDDLRIGGTADRILLRDNVYYAADLKTGSIQWGGLKIAQQLAVYARCVPYDPATQRRVPRDYPINPDVGIVIHVPAGSGTATLYAVPISRGWDAVACSASVRKWRAVKDWFTPLTGPEGLAAYHPALPGLALDAQAATTAAIAAARSLDALYAVWRDAAAAGTWTDDHLHAAKARKTELERTTA
jgi:hypothetical protein